MKTALLLIDWIGCPRNMLLKQRIQNYLKANDWELGATAGLARCQLVVFCTCGFTQVQQQRSLLLVQAVHERISRLRQPPLFVVTGCLPPMRMAKLQRIHHGPAFGPLEVERLDDLIGARVKWADVPEPNHVPTAARVRSVVERRYALLLKRLQTTHNTVAAFRRALIPGAKNKFDDFQMGDRTWSVQTSRGCLGNCSYCTIRMAKGALKSLPIDQVVQHTRQGIDLGYDQVALIADDNGAYGRDIGTDFGMLLATLNGLTGRFSLLIDSLSAHHFLEFYETIRESCRLGKVPRLMLALQHVDPTILNSMHRPCDAALLKQRLTELTTDVPNLIIHAHVIICYPGETDAAFDELTAFLRWLVRLNPLNEFRAWTYSPNPGTPAAALPGRVPQKIVRKRQIAIGKIHTRRAYVLGCGAAVNGAGPLADAMFEIRSISLVMPAFFLEKAVLWLKRMLEYEVLTSWFRPSPPAATPLTKRAGRLLGKFF